MTNVTVSPLQERINADLRQAMLARNDVAKLALRAVKTALTEASKAGADHALSEEQVLAAIRREVKRRRDAATEYEKVGATAKAEAEMAEATILEKYLPAELSEAQVEEIVRAVIAELGATSMRDMGKVMAAAMTRVNGLADGKVVNQVARRLLA
ncbi:MAG: GatB/YqeY domain-containing protein [Caldilineaceae bacterium]